MNCIEKLPKYMKVFYGVIYQFYEEIEKDINKDNIPYAIHYAKEGVRSFNLLINVM